MAAQMPPGPFCQSCGMPLAKPEDHGTERDGARSRDYCKYCYARGAFTEPRITMGAMIDKCVPIMAQRGIMPAAEARVMMSAMLPRLKRWSGVKAAAPAGGPV